MIVIGSRHRQFGQCVQPLQGVGSPPIMKNERTGMGAWIISSTDILGIGFCRFSIS